MQSRGFLPAVLLLLAAAPVGAQSPARPHLDALVGAIRAGDSATIARFVATDLAPHFRDAVPLAVHVQTLGQLHRDFRDAEARLDRQSPAEVAVRLARGARRVRLTVTHEPEAPGRITGIRIGPDASALDGVRTSVDLTRRLDSLARVDRFAGVVQVTRGDRVLHRSVHGLADRARGIRMAPDTRVDLGSITKLVTQLAILRLAQDGRLRLDDPVGRYVDGFPPAVAERVTIRHLLRHESGLGDYLGYEEVRADPSRFRSLADYLPLIAARPLEFEPGARERYSNSGYVVLGAVLERVTGLDFDAAHRRLVYEPAGMTASGAFPRGGPDVATGYTRAGGTLAPNTMLPPRGTSAGGTFSTAADLQRLGLALLDDRLLDAAHTDLLFNRFLDGRRGRGPIAVAGGAPGVNAELVLVPADRRVIVVLANLDPPAAAEVAQPLEALTAEW
ncbi:MAG: serine hydrolase domain-containing protein [Gemmatimonadales bacterium]|nr:serine hydrolase domain-containing protein [Gemmatimonadales bacterium]